MQVIKFQIEKNKIELCNLKQDTNSIQSSDSSVHIADYKRGKRQVRNLVGQQEEREREQPLFYFRILTFS
jgi:hypothetical protein